MKHILFTILSFMLSATLSLQAKPDKVTEELEQKANQKKNNDGSIAGHILDAASGEHLPFINVSLQGTTIATVADATGHYVLRNIPEGSFTVVASFMGYRSEEHSVAVESGKTLGVNFTMLEQAISVDQVVVTATRNETDKRSSATIVNVLSGQLFEKTSSCTLAESMSFQPGVRVEFTCSNCGVPQLQINGLQGEYTQLLLNSRPIFSSLASVYGLEQLPASMIERVEVIRGGGSALFGSNAVAGVVNIITKEPLRSSATLSSSTGIFGEGSIDQNTSFSGSFVSDDSKTGVYLFGSIRDRDYYDRNGDEFSELPTLSAETMGFRFTHRLGAYAKLTAEYHRMREFRRGGNKFDLPPHEADIAEQLRHRINGGGVQYELLSPNQLHRMSVYVSGQWIDRESYFGTNQDPNAYGSTDDKTLVAGAQYAYRIEKMLLSPSELTVGAEWTTNSLHDKMLGYGRDLPQSINIKGIYLQNEWGSEKVNFVLGARLDKHSLIKNVIFTPRASLRYTPSPWISLRTSYSSGYRAPQVYNEDLHVGAVGGNVSLIELDPDLRPEYSHSWSASADLYKSFGSLQTNLLVEGFYTRLDDVFALIEKGRDAQGNLLLWRQNASGATVKGINVEGIIGLVGVADLQAGYTLQRNRYREPEVWSSNLNIEPQTRMFRAPDSYAYFTATVSMTPTFKGSVFGKYTGSMLVQHFEGYVPEDREVITPAFYDMGVRLSYALKLSEGLNLNFAGGVKNIFDQFQNDLDEGALRDAGFIYGPMFPRTFFIEVRLTL